MDPSSRAAHPERWVVIVTGGGPLGGRAAAAVSALPSAVAVIAADGGLDDAVAAGLVPTHVVGDLDSLSAAGRMWAYAHGLTIDEHPTAKDLTDTELALATAQRLGGTLDGLLVVGGVGERLDHLLGVLLALGGPNASAFGSVRAVIGDTEFVVVRPHHRVELELEAGQTFSVLALHGPCRGVHVSGARWELDDAALAPTEARGVSNVAEGTVAIAVADGVLSVVVPS
ncbi:MAG: thiamine diphosphokinase [Ilumatobacteraceae bacterium]